MGCPVAQSTQSSSVDAALSRCPFLHAVAQQQGVEFARQVALAPTVPVNLQAKVPVLEEHYSFDISAQRVHGPNGAVPLARFCTSAPVMELRASDLGHRTVRKVGAVASISLGGAFFGGLVRDSYSCSLPKHTPAHF